MNSDQRIVTDKFGRQILADPFLNKGTAFSTQERNSLGLQGLLPPRIQTIEQQSTQAWDQICSRHSDLEKRRFLMRLFSVNRTLFYRVCVDHISDLLPIIYDPTIAQSIENYSHEFVDTADAVYLTPEDAQAGRIDSILQNAAAGRKIQLIVVTDAQAILGIGDWGTNGVDISVGKLMVYTAAAGIDPRCVLPVVLDVGTDRQSLLTDPLYLGVNHARNTRGDGEKEYLNLVDTFVEQSRRLFPRIYLHFEDFGRSHAHMLLNRYRGSGPVFNDDIEGTGIVVLGAILAALRVSGDRLANQRYVCFGAGSAGTGIVERVCDEMIREGLDPQQARARFWLVDRQGLLTDDMPDLTEAQKKFARPASEFTTFRPTTLAQTVEAIKPTILVGTSTVAGAFTQEIVSDMSSWCDRPIILPISNPTSKMEATAADLLTWSHGRALVATGIPSDPVKVAGQQFAIGQANNALIYPALGLGVIAAQARLVSDDLLNCAAHALADCANLQYSDTPDGRAILPPVSQLPQYSQTIARAVARRAVAQGLSPLTQKQALERVDELRWEPVYRPEVCADANNDQ
jgi:malic enzyme